MIHVHVSLLQKSEDKPRSGSLFDNDEGEDDLFGVPAAKPKDRYGGHSGLIQPRHSKRALGVAVM